jgi:thiamine pyrophosphokinase
MYQLIYSFEDGRVSSIKRVPDGASIPLAVGNADYQEFLEWNGEQAVSLDLNSISQEILDDNAARILAQKAKTQSIIDNLPSWSAVGGKFDSMLADAKAATNLAQAKAVLIELIKTQKKMARILYWNTKDTEE